MMRKALLLPLVTALLISCADSSSEEKQHEAAAKDSTDLGTYNGIPISEKEPDNYTGEYIELYKNGLPKMRGQKVNGVRQGKWQSWHPNGAKASEVSYVDGKENGKYIVYHDNGQIRHTGRYSMGEKVDKWKFYSEEGELVLDTIFNP